MDEADIEAVARCIRSGWLTTGRITEDFERAFASRVGCPWAVGTNSGTAALELALATFDVGPNDEVITTPYTFVATIDAIMRRGAKPVLVDVDPVTGNIDPAMVAHAVGPQTRAILPVHLGGFACDMSSLCDIARDRNLALIVDAAHAIEAQSEGRPVASEIDASCFSFYANKNLTTGEGGMVVFSDEARATRARCLRHHGITRDAWSREHKEGFEQYEVTELGLKCNPSDMASALGLSQLKHIDGWLSRRREVVARYDQAFEPLEGIKIPPRPDDRGHAWHLYMLRWMPPRGIDRNEASAALAALGVGTAVHYKPVHLLAWFRDQLAQPPGSLPNAEALGQVELSLPLYPGLTDAQVDHVIESTRIVAGRRAE